MTFSADWLALREPADLAARDTRLLERAAKAAGANPVIVDLGCGTGATMRTMSPLLGGRAQWRLVDNAPELLERAMSHAEDPATPHLVDLSDVGQIPLGGASLVTASALLDLVSTSWLDNLVQTIDTPFYAALSYDGEMSWNPADWRDDIITDAFNQHQRSDKGFGQALGAACVDTAVAIFEAAGWSVTRARSDWHLGAGDEELQRELVSGIAHAAHEQGESKAHEWGRLRNSAAASSTCVVGHEDILAFPPGFEGGPSRADD